MKRFFILIVIICFMTPSLVYAGSHVYIDDFTLNSAIDFLIGPEGRGEVGIPGLNRGDIIYIEIVVTSGDGVDVMVLDDENHDAFIHYQTYTCLAQYLNQKSLSVAVSVPSAGEWHVVFRNPTSECRVQGSVTTSIFETPMFVNSMIFISFFAIVAIIVGIYWKGREIRKKSTPQSHEPPSESFLE